MDISRIFCIDVSARSLLYNAQIKTVEDVLSIGDIALSQTLGISGFAAHDLRQTISQQVIPNSKSCFDMLLEIRDSSPFLVVLTLLLLA